MGERGTHVFGRKRVDASFFGLPNCWEKNSEGKKKERKRKKKRKKERKEKGRKEEREKRRMAGHLRPAGDGAGGLAGGQGRQPIGQPKPDQGRVQV